MNTYNVTYYYLATGMEGHADTADYGLVDAETSEQAKEKVALRQYPRRDWQFEWLKGCLTAYLVK